MPADATELPAAAALADNAANPTAPAVGSHLLAYDGSTWDRVTNGGGVEATALRVTLANDSTGLVSVDDNAGSLTVDNAALAVVGGGAEATALRVTIASDSTGVVSIDDNAASLTIDNSTLAVVGTGTEATAMRVTLATDSTGVLSVDDNGGSLTVDIGTALPAGTALIGKVGIDQTTPGTTDSVSVATAQGAGATIGVTTGAKATTDANATIQQYLRGLVTLQKGASVDVNAALVADADAAVAASAGLRLVGFAARESAGTAAAATFFIVHGATGAGGTVVARVELLANESAREWWWPGIDVASGISIDWVAGTVDVELFYTDVE